MSHDEYPHSSRVIGRIFDERCRQQAEEGFPADLDNYHIHGELARAAACYAQWASQSDEFRENYAKDGPGNWPGNWDESWFKPGDRIRELEKAGALIVAEIERLERLAQAVDPAGEGKDETVYAIGTDRVGRAPFGPVGSGHMPQDHYSGPVLSRTPDIGISLVMVSITEEEFRKWVLGIEALDDEDTTSLWQSFKEAAGWPRY